MAVTVNHLVAPRGELEHALFPMNDLEERVAACILDGYAKVAGLAAEDRDDAVTAYVHFRIYTAVARRLAVEPERAEVDDLVRTYNIKQAEHFQRLATAAKTIFDEYLAAQPATPTKRRRAPGSAHVSSEAVW